MSLKNKILNIGQILQKKKGMQQVSLMLLITLITQAISMYKSAITASNFGACVELDAYNFANNLSTFFLTFVSTGITTVIIPSYVRKADRKAIDTFLSVVFSIVGLLLVAIFAFRTQLVDILTNREAEFGYYVNDLLLLTILIQFFPALLGVTTAYYQCIGKFNFPKVVLLISNIATMLVYLSLDKFTIYQYLYVMLAGVLFQFVVDLVYAVKCGFCFRITFDIHNTEYTKMCKIFIPTLIGTGIYKVNTMVDSLLSSNLGTGQLTILTYSTMVVGLVNSLIIGNLVIYVYPKIVAKMSISLKECQKELYNYIMAFHVVVSLLIVGFITVGREFIGILYERGQFTAEAADAVYFCMCIYIFGQQANVIRDLLYRYFMADGDTQTTTKNGLMTSCINIICSFLMIRFLGVYGIAVGTVIAGMISLCGIALRMKNKYGFTSGVGNCIKEILKTECALICSIIIVLLIKSLLLLSNDVLIFLIFGVLSVIVFGGILLLLHSKAFKIEK